MRSLGWRVEPERIVRDGYDAIAGDYTASRASDGPAAQPFLEELIATVPDNARVLDAGCGGGLPILARLAERFPTVGVDVSVAQLRIARGNAPAARLVCQDMRTLAFPAGSFDAIVCTYALFHVPRDDHTRVLENFARMLRPRGHLLVSLGFTDWVGTGDFYGGQMYWSHFDRDTNLTLVRDAGFDLLDERIAIERPAGRHPFVLARRR